MRLDVVRSGEQRGFAPIQGKHARAGERRVKNVPGDFGDERTGIHDEQSVDGPQPDPAGDFPAEQGIAEIVSRYENSVGGPDIEVVECMRCDLRFDAGAGDEGALSIGFNHYDAEAAVAPRAWREQRRNVFTRQVGANPCAVRPRSVPTAEDAGQTVARRRGQDVEPAARADGGGRSEHVAAARRQMRHVDADVGDDAADAEKTLRAKPQIHGRRSPVLGAKGAFAMVERNASS